MRCTLKKAIALRSLSCVMSALLLMSNSMITALPKVFASNDTNGKLDEMLLDAINQSAADQRISTAIWFDDIDYHDVYDQERAILSQRIEEGNTPQAIMDIIDESEKALSANLPLSCVQEAIQLEREIAKEQYLWQNKLYFYDTLPDYSNREVFISSYAPCVLAELTVDEIMLLADSDAVQSLMLCENTEISDDLYDAIEVTVDEDLTSSANSSYPRFNQFKEDIGVTAAQQLVDTSGIVIGILEGSGKPDMTKTGLTSINSSGRFHIIPTNMSTASHATVISTILAGKTNDGFEGVAYDATYYYTCDDYYTSYQNLDHRRMAAAEDLIDHDVNIITRSVSVGNYGNAYGVFSRFYDHISTCHHVHFCTAVGNITNGIINVCNSNMGYNTIVVGSMTYNGVGYYYSPTTSSYSTNPLMPYKPDVCAPQGLEMPFDNLLHYGSSYATPITAGALAYFLKSNSMVVWRPEIGKAAVCSGSRIATTNSSPNSTSASQIAMDRTVGVGMLNIYPAVNALYNWDMSGGDNFNFGFHLANTSLNFSHTINVTNADIAASKRMNVCYCYNVRNTYASGISHNTNAPAIGTVYPIIMTVTSPNGTVYTSNYAYTNMEVVSFIPAVAGTYTVNVYFADSSETFEGETHFGFMANVISQSSSI